MQFPVRDATTGLAHQYSTSYTRARPHGLDASKVREPLPPHTGGPAWRPRTKGRDHSRPSVRHVGFSRLLGAIDALVVCERRRYRAREKLWSCGHRGGEDACPAGKVTEVTGEGIVFSG